MDKDSGHVTRMPDEGLPNKVFYGELQEGKHSQGGQKKLYKETLKALLKDFSIPTESWEQDQTKWRCLIRKGAAQYEEKRVCEAERKHKECRNHHQRVVTVRAHLLCICNRMFKAKIGLFSHQRTHNHT